MMNHILVSTLVSQSVLNRCCSINSSSLASFPISCVNSVDGSNTDFACVCGNNEPSAGVTRAWTAYLIFNCMMCKNPSCGDPRRRASKG